VTISEFKALIIGVDPKATRNKGAGTNNYTVWSVGGNVNVLISDDEPDEITKRCYIDRFTKSDSDAITDALEAALIEHFVPYEYEQMYEEDTGYTHHSFTCYVG